MTEDNKNSNLIILGIAALAAMFFAYLIYSSNKQQSQSPSTQPDQLQKQVQDLLNMSISQQQNIQQIQQVQLQQANNIIELENTKCSSTTTIPQTDQPSETQPTIPQEDFIPGSDLLGNVSTVSMANQSHHKKLTNVNKTNVGREIDELYANRAFGMA